MQAWSYYDDIFLTDSSVPIGNYSICLWLTNHLLLYSFMHSLFNNCTLSQSLYTALDVSQSGSSLAMFCLSYSLLNIF